MRNSGSLQPYTPREQADGTQKKGAVWKIHFAFGETVRGLTLTGFRYPLNDYDMESVSALGVSNELTAAEGIISMKSGTLVVIESKDGEL